MPTPSDETLRVLIIRRDNIGDLVCTTPMFRALRQRFPRAQLHALVNAYNAPVLDNNPDVDRVHVYHKAKHRDDGRSLLRVYAAKARLLWHLRQTRFDYVLVPNRGYAARAMTLARWLRPRHTIGFVDATAGRRRPDIAIPHDGAAGLQEAEDIFRLLAPLGIQESPPPVRVVPSPTAVAHAAATLRQAGVAAPVAVHISARKPSNRWPTERFAELIRELYRCHGLASMLFWAPGDAANKQHPGDDAAAMEILRRVRDVPVVPYPTHTLASLIGGLACCRAFVGSDGGAMHVAAGVGLPVLAFFGRSGVERWRPWGVPQLTLQPPTREASDITVTEALAGFAQLLSAATERATACSAHTASRI